MTISWRKSLWNGFASVPIILRLDGDLLTLKTTKNTVWKVPILETKCRFTLLGTMIVTAVGKDYALVTAGSSVSKSFSKEQLAELAQESGHYNAGADAATRVGVGASAIGAAGVVGAPLAAVAYTASTAANIDTWRGEFESRGLLVVRDKKAKS